MESTRDFHNNIFKFYARVSQDVFYYTASLDTGNNVFDDDPPFASGGGGNGVGYPGFTYDATNRFWYWSITKKF